MKIATLQHELNRQLAGDLRDILREPSFIYVDSLEPERDRLPVTRGLIEGMAEALQLADRKIIALETMTLQMAGMLRDILQTRDTMTARRALEILAKVEDVLQR